MLADMVEAMEWSAIANLEEPADLTPHRQLSTPRPAVQIGRLELPTASSPPALQAVPLMIEEAPAIDSAQGVEEAHVATDEPRPWAAPAVLPVLHAASSHVAPHAAQHPSQPRLPLNSPNVLTRPFAHLLDSAERKQREVSRRTVANSQYVYVPGYGPMPVALAHDMGLQRQSLVAAGALLGKQQVESTPVLEAADAQIQATMPSQPNMPQLRVLKSVHQIWEVWAAGDRLSGTCAISRLPESVRNQKGKKQRFSEWKQAAAEIEQMVAEMPSTSSGPPMLQQILKQLENERMREKMPMASFIKALGNCKRRKAQGY